MKNMALVIMMMIFIPFAYAGSGQVQGPLSVLGAQDFDDDNNSGTNKLTTYAWLMFDTGAASYDGDTDNNSTSYDTECVEGYLLPIWINLSTDKGKAMYSSANSAVLSGYDVVVAYTENAAGFCVADDLFILAP